MKYKNSFFRIEIKETGTYLDLFPPQADGNKLEINEIMSFLDRKKIDYQVDTLKKALIAIKDKPGRFKLSDIPIEPFGESCVINITPDRMLAYARFYPPSTNGSVMNEKEIMSELELKKIKSGICEKSIELFQTHRQYCVNIPIAKGVKPIHAKDTVIEYLFETRPLAKPKLNEDGSVDFHELNLFTRVSKGQVLAKLYEHVDGVNGLDVYGNVIACNKPRIKKFKYGRNLIVSEDGKELISEVDGDVTLTNDTVFVSDTYKIAADVDASTGDIDYDGSVFIPGNVRTGFTVKAKGDIQVNGVVEGATLIADGDIVIKRGVQGMSRGKLVAGGDLSAQFLESSNVKVEGNINVGSILHSNVNAGGKVIVCGKKGFIVGGEVICENLVEVNTIGNKMETQTLIKVGVKPELIDELKVLMNKVNDMNKEIEETSSYLNVYRNKIKKGVKLTPQNLKQVKELTSQLEIMETERDENNERMRVIKEEVDKGKNGKIKVQGETFIGTTIFIASKIYNVKQNMVHCMYKISNGEIDAVSF